MCNVPRYALLVILRYLFYEQKQTNHMMMNKLYAREMALTNYVGIMILPSFI